MSVRVFQNINARPAYQRRLDTLCGKDAGYEARIRALIDDGFNGVHILHPVRERTEGTFLTCSVDARLQRAWAKERGMPAAASPDQILLAQIEDIRAEIFYTQAPYRFPPAFMRRLPGCVRARVGWHSPPAPLGDISAYDLIVNNFPRSLALYASEGVRTAYFAPSFDPVMEEFCEREDRPIDVAFVGGYSRHHRQRAVALENVASLDGRYRVRFALDPGRLTRLAESPLGWLPPLAKHARPQAIRRVSTAPVFGRAMYEMFSRAKIVLNGAVDSAGDDRGNMRCFEAMGCGALLLTDPGRYPEGMEDDVTMRLYADEESMLRIIHSSLEDVATTQALARKGLDLIRRDYSKALQWQRFQSLVE